MIYDVFISYSTLDKKIAEGICGYLESNGYRCFVAYRDIPKGIPWSSAIPAAIDESEMMVAVFSKNFDISEQTDREIVLAAKRKMPILTYRIADDKFTGTKEYYLSNLNWIDAFPNPEEYFGRLLEDIQKLISQTPSENYRHTQKDESQSNFQTSSNQIPLPNLKLKADVDCVFYLDGEKCLNLKAGSLTKLPLAKGEYELKFVSEENDKDVLEMEFAMPEVDKLLKVTLSEVVNNRLQKEEEERKAAEEAKRKLEEERRAAEAEKRRVEEEKRKEEERRQKEKEGKFTVNGVEFKMVFVEGGTFTMGATSEQGSDADDDEYPTHRVTLSDYYIGETEVTQALWQAVMGSNPSWFKGNNLPVESVSYNDVKEFITKLNQKTGKTFRLPTEAEWEYAARGGKKSKGYKYSGSNNIDDVAWYDENSNDKTHPVKTKRPNELEIYDMSGNVLEWCSDWYGDYLSNAQTNPQGPSSGSDRVLRGGSWGGNARYCRASDRGYGFLSFLNYNLGFRLALAL